MSGFPAQGIWQKDRESQNLTLKVSGMCLQDFHRTGENRALLFGGQHKQNNVHQDPDERSSDPTEAEPDLRASPGEVSCGEEAYAQ